MIGTCSPQGESVMPLFMWMLEPPSDKLQGEEIGLKQAWIGFYSQTTYWARKPVVNFGPSRHK